MLNNKSYSTQFAYPLIILLKISVSAWLLSGCAVLDAGVELVTGATDYFLETQDDKTLPAELIAYEPEIEIDLLWQEEIGVGTDDQFLNLVPAVGYGNILAADKDGLVQARDAKTGDLIWESATDFSFSAGPSIGNKTVILTTSDAEVIALDFATGIKQWQTSVSSEVLAIPAIAQGIIIIQTTDGKVIALSEEDGSELWVFERNVPALSVRGTSSPLITKEYVIVAYANGKLIALRMLDGKNEWESNIVTPSGRSEIERLVDIDVAPVATNGVIFIASFQSGTSAVLELDGDILWQNDDVSSFSGLSFDGHYLYISDAQSHIWQLDQRNGGSLWRQDALHHRILTAPVNYDDYVVVADYEGYIHWLSNNDGRQLGRIQTSKQGIDAKLVVADDIVYAYAKDGTLTALRAKLF